MTRPRAAPLPRRCRQRPATSRRRTRPERPAASLATTSTSHSGSVTAWLIVGGITPWKMVSAVIAASRPPAAPRVCPSIDLTDVTGSRVRPIAEHEADAARFGAIVVRRGRAVRVHVLDSIGVDRRVRQRPAHGRRDGPAVGLGRGRMKSLAGQAMAGDFGVDAGARRRAASKSSSTSIAAPSPIFMPARPRSNGRQLLVSMTLQRIEPAEGQSRENVGAAGQRRVEPAAAGSRRSPGRWPSCSRHTRRRCTSAGLRSRNRRRSRRRAC